MSRVSGQLLRLWLTVVFPWAYQRTWWMRTFALAVWTFQSAQKQHNVDACSFHSKYLFFKAEVQQQRVLFVRSVDTSFTIQREEKSPNSRERLKHINVLWHAVYIILPSHLPDAVRLLLCSCFFSSVLAFPRLLAFSIWLVYYSLCYFQMH